jgi:uncharacterized protein with LGFP repeats
MRFELRADVLFRPVSKENQTDQVPQLQQHEGRAQDFPLRGEDFEKELTLREETRRQKHRAHPKLYIITFAKGAPFLYHCSEPIG